VTPNSIVPSQSKPHKANKPEGGGEENKKPVTPPPSKPTFMQSYDKNKGFTTTTSGGPGGIGRNGTMRLSST
jgi:hypothetical protein